MTVYQLVDGQWRLLDGGYDGAEVLHVDPRVLAPQGEVLLVVKLKKQNWYTYYPDKLPREGERLFVRRNNAG